jgi:surfeit locus 1 family protein
MAPQTRRPRSLALLALLLVLAALAAAGFGALGVWQVHRLAWKEALIARVDRHLHAALVAAPGPGQWGALTRDADEYRRVQAQGRFAYDREALVRALTTLGTGYWVLTPLRTDGGEWLLVNRGFVPSDLKQRVPHGPERASVTGLLRFSEPGGTLLQHNDPALGRWYSRDVGAIARAGQLAGAVAPYFVDAQAGAGADPAGWPRPGLTVVHFNNDHLVYAVTWFTLAAMMLAAIAALVVDEQRLRRSGAATLDAHPQP